MAINFQNEIDSAEELLQAALSNLHSFLDLHPEYANDITLIIDKIDTAKSHVSDASLFIFSSPEIEELPDDASADVSDILNDADDILDGVRTSMEETYDYSDDQYDYGFNNAATLNNKKDPFDDFDALDDDFTTSLIDADDDLIMLNDEDDIFQDADVYDGYEEASLFPFGAPIPVMAPANMQMFQQSGVPMQNPFGAGQFAQNNQQEQPTGDANAILADAMSHIKNNTSIEAMMNAQLMQELPSLDIEVAAVPFFVKYIHINNPDYDPNKKHSMFVTCEDENIGEWDMPSLLAGNDVYNPDFNITSFSFKTLLAPRGNEQYAPECNLEWDKKRAEFSASVYAGRGIGVLTETAAQRNIPKEKIDTSESDNTLIIEIVPEVLSASQALSFFPTSPVLYAVMEIGVSFMFKNIEYTMYVRTNENSIEIEWDNKTKFTLQDMAELIKHLAINLKPYAVDKNLMEKINFDIADVLPNRPTETGYYFDHPDVFTMAKGYNRFLNKQYNIENIQVKDGSIVCTPYVDE